MERPLFFKISLFLLAVQFILVPTTYPEGKLICMIPVLGYSFLSSFNCRIKRYEGALLILLYSFTNMFFCTYGALSNNPGAYKVMTVDVLYPLLFLVLASSFPYKQDMRTMMKFFLYSTLFLSIYDLLYYVAFLLGYSSLIDNFYSLINTDNHMGSSDLGFLSFTSYHTEMYIFLVPTLLFSTIYEDYYKKNKIFTSKIIVILTLVLSSFACFLASSRALVVCVTLSFLIVSYYKFFKKGGVNIVWLLLILFVIFIAIVNYWGFNNFVDWADELFNSIINGLDETNISAMGEAEYLRYKQKLVLYEKWQESPIFGFGAGASATEIIRNSEQPWSYELTYYALLFQKGVVGLIIFMFISFRIIIMLYRNKEYHWFTVPYMSGFICFLLGNAINPCMAKLGFIWIFFLPLILCDNLKKISTIKTRNF